MTMMFEPLVLPFPPSLNSYYRNVSTGKLAGRTLISEAGRRYRQAVYDLAARSSWPRFGEERLRVTIEAWMPDRRRRDLDNVLKAVLDALTHALVWRDDSQIDDLRIVRVPSLGGMLKVHVESADQAVAIVRAG